MPIPFQWDAYDITAICTNVLTSVHQCPVGRSYLYLQKMVSVQHLFKRLIVDGFIFKTQVYNYKKHISVKLDFGNNPSDVFGVIAPFYAHAMTMAGALSVTPVRLYVRT